MPGQGIEKVESDCYPQSPQPCLDAEKKLWFWWSRPTTHARYGGKRRRHGMLYEEKTKKETVNANVQRTYFATGNCCESMKDCEV